MALWDFFLKINGADSVTALGLQVTNIRGHWDSPTFIRDVVQVPRHDGPVQTVVEPELDARDFIVEFWLDLSSEAAFETAVDNVKYGLAHRDLTLIVGNQDARYRTGRLNSPIEITPTLGEGVVETAAGKFTVRCLDPIARSTSNTTVAGAAATDHDCVLGTWVSWPVVTVTSPTSPLVLTAKNSVGATVGELTLAFLGSPTTVVVDMAACQITVDGTRRDSYLTAGDFFALDPNNGDRDMNLPTIRCSSGTISAVYVEAWL